MTHVAPTSFQTAPLPPSLYADTAIPPVDLDPLTGDATAEVAIVGGGFTGLWTAWHLHELEPSARVAVVEADVCGRGPSGRNGGFCNGMWISLASMRARWGDGFPTTRCGRCCPCSTRSPPAATPRCCTRDRAVPCG